MLEAIIQNQDEHLWANDGPTTDMMMSSTTTTHDDSTPRRPPAVSATGTFQFNISSSSVRRTSISMSSECGMGTALMATSPLTMFFPRCPPPTPFFSLPSTPAPCTRSVSSPFPLPNTTFIHHHRATLTTLPHELISQIFLLTFNPTPRRPNTDSLASLPLSQICRKLRSVAHKTQDLWNYLILVRPDPLKKPEDWHMLQKMFVGLAKNASLHITFSLAQPLPPSKKEWSEEKINSLYFSPNQMAHIVTWLLPTVHSWETLRIYCDTFAPIHTFLNMTSHVEGDMRLKNFELTRCNPYHAEVTAFHPAELAAPIKLFGGNPGSLKSLERVRFDGVHVDWEAFAESIFSPVADDMEVDETAPSSSTPKTRLTHLSLKYHCASVRPALPTLTDILEASRETLTTLVLEGSGPSVQPAPPFDSRIKKAGEVVTRSFPHLHTLRMMFHSRQLGSTMLSTLFSNSGSSLPSLKRLGVGDVSRTQEYHLMEDNGLVTVVDFFNTLGGVLPPTSGLEELWITDMESRSSVWTEAFASSQKGCWDNVKVLGMISMRSGLMRALQHAGTDLLPALEEVYVHAVSGCGVGYPFSDGFDEEGRGTHCSEPLIQFLGSRRAAPSNSSESMPGEDQVVGEQKGLKALHVYATEVDRMAKDDLDAMSEFVDVKSWQRVPSGFAPGSRFDDDEESDDEEEGEDGNAGGDEDDADDEISDDEARRQVEEANDWEDAFSDADMDDEGVEWNDGPFPFPFGGFQYQNPHHQNQNHQQHAVDEQTQADKDSDSEYDGGLVMTDTEDESFGTGTTPGGTLTTAPSSVMYEGSDCGEMEGATAGVPEANVE